MDIDARKTLERFYPSRIAGNQYFRVWNEGPRDGTKLQIFYLKLLLKRTYSIPGEPQIPLQNDLLMVSLQAPETPSFSPEYPGSILGLSGHWPGISGFPVFEQISNLNMSNC